jgi:cyclopropane fatty-acyl-phospholipid synthase-like methyltransferase
MAGTPEWQKDRVRAYYRETNERSYLANWSGKALSFHYGLSDETTTSLDEAHLLSNAYLADALAIGEGTRVLDAGCGVGGTSIWLAEHRRAKLTGLTLDPGQVSLANGFAEARGVASSVAFHVMDYAATTFPEASFDVAFNLESFCHCVDPRGYFEHLLHLLGEGGRYGCMEFFIGSGMPERIEEVKEGWAMPGWQTMEATVEALRSAGFAEVEVTDLGKEVRRSAEQMIAMAKNTLLTMRLSAAIDGKTNPVFEGHVRAAIACSEGLLDGSVTYGFVQGRRPPR